MLKVQDIAHIRAAPPVNRLIRVADHAQIFILGGKQIRQHVLRNVGVLILVNRNVAKPLLILIQHGGIFAEKFHGRKNQVVEVERVIFLQLFLIQLVNLRDVGGIAVAVVTCLFAEFCG